MGKKLYSFVVIVSLLWVSVKSQRPDRDPEGPVTKPPSSRPCRPVAPPSLPNDIGSRGQKYPSKEINKFLNDNPSIKAMYKKSLKYRKICSSRQLYTLPILKLFPTCPALKIPYRIPVRIFNGRENCWVLKQWAKKKCPRVRCISSSCRFVKASSPLPTACIPTEIVRLPYYIWCPKARKVFQRRLYLPQCCSCTAFKCIFNGK